MTDFDVLKLIVQLCGLDPKDIGCDGCSGRFTMDKITPVSGCYNLCHKCFKEWYPEFSET